MKTKILKSVILIVATAFVTANSFAAPKCEPHKTHQTTSYRTGDDGYFQLGVELKPAAERFAVHSFSGTETNILDTLTGLIWSKNANHGTMNWAGATNYCETLVYGGRSDWRLPNVNEHLSLVDFKRLNPSLPSGYGSFFNSVAANKWYWSSTQSASYSSEAWTKGIYSGMTYSILKTSTVPYVWPVCGP